MPFYRIWIDRVVELEQELPDDEAAIDRARELDQGAGTAGGDVWIECLSAGGWYTVRLMRRRNGSGPPGPSRQIGS
jgi:hypothetical protein